MVNLNKVSKSNLQVIVAFILYQQVLLYTQHLVNALHVSFFVLLPVAWVCKRQRHFS